MPGKMYPDYDNATIGLDDLVMIFKDGKNVITTIKELRGVVNNLVSGGANSPLSAEQGVKLLERIGDFLYQKAEGTATEIELPMKTLVDGYFKNFIAKSNNESAPTTVNDIPLFKPNTNTPPKLVASRAYTIRYDEADNCFFLEASATGNALESEVLAGKVFSTENGVDLVGTLNLSSLVSGNIKSGVTINGVSGKVSVVDTADANAIAAQILSGVTAYVNGVKVTGTIPKKAAATITPGTTNQTIAAGQYMDGVQTILGDVDLIAANIKAGASIFGVSGSAAVSDTTDATAIAAEILSGKTAYVNGSKVTGTIASKGATTYTPGTANQTIPAGQYLSGTQTIAGDADLVTENIKSGASIFGVSGKASVVDTSDALATASQLLSGASAYVGGIKITGTIDSKAAETITPGTVNKTIAANQYLSGIQTILGDADLVTGNIKSGASIFGVAGKASVVDTVDATAIAADLLAGKTAYVNGIKLTGTGSVTRRFVTGTTKGIAGIINASLSSSAGIRADTLVNITGFDFVPTVAFVYLANLQMPVVFSGDRAMWDHSIYLKSENANFIVQNGRLQMPGSPNSIGSDYIYEIYE